MTFEDRERGFEAKYVHDETMRFRAEARRDRLFADWAARQYGLSQVDSDRFHQAVLAVPGGAGHEAALMSLVYGLGPVAAGQPHAEPSAVLAECAARAMLPSEDHGSPFDL